MDPTPIACTTPWIPEVMTQAGAYLTPPDLLSAVCVCRHWNRCLIPLLWYHIDDSLYSWQTLVTRMSSSVGAEDDHRQQEARDRMQRAFEKYGPHIRRLILSHRDLLKTVSTTAMNGSGEGPCTQLQRLDVSLVNIRSPKERAEDERVQRLTREERAKEQERARANGMPPVLSSVFDGVFEPSKGPFRNAATRVKDWETNQLFWMLILQNRERIQSLSIDWTITGSCTVAKPSFLYETLGGMKRLVSFKNEMAVLDLSRLLESVPTLERYSTWIHLLGSGLSLQGGAPFLSLRVLEVKGPIDGNRVGEILGLFPELDRLSLGRLIFTDTNTRATTTATIAAVTASAGISTDSGDTGKMVTTKQSCPRSRLKVLEFELPSLPMATPNALLDVLSLVPHLTSLSIKELGMETATAIGRNCELLESFSLRIGGEPNPAQQEQPGSIEQNALNIILQSCCRLKSVDASRCTIAADHLSDNRPAWVCHDLELLRCQMVGFLCLTDEQQEALQTIRGPDFAGCEWSFYERQVLRFANRRQEQHRAVYDRIAGLKRLVTLDLGSGYKSRTLPGLHYQQQRQRGLTQRNYLDDEGGLELSLSMGLGRLSTLVSLEEVGFEGHDCAVAESEVEWMVKSWPRLKAVKGLCERAQDDGETRKRKSSLRGALGQLKMCVSVC